MRKIFQILIFTLIPLMGFSQIDKLLKNKNLYCGIKLGINHSKFRNEIPDLNYGTRPLLGLYAKYRIVKQLYIKSSAAYSFKNSKSARPYLNFENQYFDFNFTPQFQIIKDIFVHAGISYSYLIAANQIVFDGDNCNGVSRINNEGFYSETSIATGIEFKLQKYLNFELNYYIPTSKNNTKNFQLTLDILLNKKEPKKETFKQILRRKSKEQIKQLKNGTLLIRLKTFEKSIEALRKSGKKISAEKFKRQQKFKNIKLISAFKKHFNFSKFVFFYSNNSKDVLNKNYKNIFLNDSLIIDNSIKIDTANSIFIADFTTVEQDTTKYFSSYRFDRNDNGAYKKNKNYYGGPNLGLYALIIKDENSFQLSKPFPYYIRASHFPLKKRPKQTLLPSQLLQKQIERSYNKTVKKLNKKLTKYYNNNN
jgi:hypothetical protein